MPQSPYALGLIVSLLSLACGYPDYLYVDEPGSPAFDSGGDPDTSPDTIDGEVPGCDKPNNCGGCNDRGVKGGRCDPCGQWECGANNKVVCTQATPAPGGACGVCGTSKQECSALGTTACAVPDDRVTYDDAKFEAKDEKIFTVNRTNEMVIAFNSVRTMAYFDMSAVVRRVPYVCAATATLPHPDSACSDCRAASGGGFDCTVPSPAGGLLTYTLYSGSPPSLAPIASASVTATSIADSKAEWITATLLTATMSKPPGTQLAIGITTDSSAYAFEIYGGGASAFPKAEATTTWWHRTFKPLGSWIEEPSSDAAHVLRGKACAP